MSEVHVNVGPIDGSGSKIIFHNPDNSNGSQPLPPSDNPAPSKSSTQVTAKIAQANGGPRFANPA